MFNKISGPSIGRFAVKCFLILCVLMFAPSLFSQSASTGALTGSLKDSSGAVVPNATVTLTSLDTAQVRTTTTSSDGTYKFGLLPPGNYSVKFESAGFNSVQVPSVTVTVTETAVLDQTLQVGAQTQQVEVHAQTEVVQTETTTVGSVVNSQVMASMPLTSRNYTVLLGLSAGANASVFNASNIGKGTQEFAVNGAQQSQNNFQQDGASIVNWTGNGFASDSGGSPGIAIVNPDAIEEFKIQTSMFDAGYGRKPGASVNVVTKSGTNQFHGSAFEFFRNTVLNANDYFRKENLPIGGVAQNGRPVLDQNQYGGVIGGPIKKDKIFFFFSYQGTSQRNGLAAAGAADPVIPGIPTGARNTPAFQAALGAAFCQGGSATVTPPGGVPATTKTQNGGTQVACNGSNINPVALNLLNLKLANGSYYIPSSPNGVNYTDFISDPATYKEYQLIGNADYVINEKNTLSGRYNFTHAVTNVVMGCAPTGTTISQCLPGGPGSLLLPVSYVTGKLTTSITSNLVNEARISVQRYVGDPQNLVPFTDTQVGIAPIIPSVNYLDGTTVTGLFKFGAFLNLATDKYITSQEVADTVSWSHGKHTIRTGFEYERDRQNWHFIGLAIGSLTFPTFQDFLIGLPGCAPSLSAAQCSATAAAGTTNGSAFSNISNSGTSASITPPGGEDYEFRAPYASAFVQDDFKVRSNLTLNLGVRWEFAGQNYAVNGENTNMWVPLLGTGVGFNPATSPVPVTQLGSTAATGTLAGFVLPSNFNFAAFPPPPVGGLFINNKKIPTANTPPLSNFGPRIGFAWKPLSSDRLVFRSGFGTFYDRVGNTIYQKAADQAQPYSITIGQTSAAANYYSSLAQPYCVASTASVPCSVAALGWQPRYFNQATGLGSNISEISETPVYLVPVTYMWNANVQYEFANQWVLELGYVGTRGVHQIPDATLNQVLEHQLNQPLIASASNQLDCGAPTGCITTNTSSNASLRVPYLGFAPSGVEVDQTIGDYKNNSLQATVRKTFSHGLSMEAAYTWSRGFTTASFINYNNTALPLAYGLMPYVRPQRLSINYSYDLPFGKYEGVLGKLTNGWTVTGVTVVQDGLPLTITDSKGGTIYGGVQTSTAQYAPGMGSANVPSVGGDKQRLGGVNGGAGWFNKAAFTPFVTTGAATPYGDAGYSNVLGPGQFNWDISLIKTTKVGGINENATLVFRSEFFNAFNHEQFNTPVSVDVNNSSFGLINSSSVNPRLIQFALKYVF
jgi:hypothetical protein